LREDVLVATGIAPGQWIKDSERLAPTIPGVRLFDRSGVVVADLGILKEQIEAISLRFEVGATRLVPGQDAELRRLVMLMTQLDDAAQSAGARLHVDISGHTDADGAAESNKSLSEARARLILASVEAVAPRALQVTANGVGDQRPLRQGNTEADKQQNRRVAVRVSIP